VSWDESKHKASALLPTSIPCDEDASRAVLGTYDNSQRATLGKRSKALMILDDICFGSNVSALLEFASFRQRVCDGVEQHIAVS
jgi:hypothetical protein